MTDIWLMISAGSGPKECSYVVERISKQMEKEAPSFGVSISVMNDKEVAKNSTSVLVVCSGQKAEAFAKQFMGTVQWIGQSPFRPNHKRKNWFVSVNKLPEPDQIPELKDSDISFQTMKASGPGGQHVNKTDSAVRATHVPSGIIVTAQEDRSQHANKRLAKVKIAAELEARKEKQTASGKKSQWRTHQNLERGNAVRTYEGVKFKLRK